LDTKELKSQIELLARNKVQLVAKINKYREKCNKCKEQVEKYRKDKLNYDEVNDKLDS
jgi:chromosome segregation ATPase